MGALPTHPELLDWLAWWFEDNGTSLKKLHKLIVTSSAYRQSSAPNAASAKIDGDNRYLWRMNRTRLDAECLHDALLSASGKIDLAVGGPSVQQFYFKDDHSPVYDYARFDPDSPRRARRSVYRFVVRSVPDPMMETLDCPDPSMLAAKRNATITALQALVLLNDPFILRQAEHLAGRVERAAQDRRTQINLLYTLTLSRPPTDAEAKAIADYADKHGLPAACRVLFNTNEFLFVD